MPVCNPCIKTKAVPNCLAQLVIGTTALTSQQVKVYIQDLATNGLLILTGTADMDGLITLELPDPSPFFDTHPYELWVTDLGAGIGAYESISINGSTSDIICLRFQSVRGDDGSVESYLTQTLMEA